jgi:outer membrane protein assembly factor BamB
LSTSPSTIVLATKAKGQTKTERVAVESSHAMYDRYVFYADMGGVLRCVDTNYLTTLWAVETGDSVMAAVALDLSSDTTLDLYTANMLSLRKTGNAQIRKYNALTGKEVWNLEIGVAKNTKTKEEVGVKASPVIGQNRLKELVYFTVTGLNDAGRQTLGVAEGTKAALVAIDKVSGEVRWARGLSDRSESSPVAVYDAEGYGWIIQCAESGEIIMVDGLTGQVAAETQIDATIKASPAVYNDIMVVGTTGKGTSYVVALKIQ